MLASASLTLPVRAQADVEAQVLNVHMKLTEQNVTDVELGGIVRNTESLPVRSVQVRINLITPDNKVVRTFLLEPFDHLQPGQQEAFKADYVLREYDPLYLKATAEVSYTPTSYTQIADWFLTQNWRNLQIWQIPVTDTAKYTERGRIESALGYLEQIERKRPDYADARRKWNLIQYTFGKRLAEAQNGHEAILRLSNVETGSEHATEASQLLEEIRVKTIYERAMKKSAEGNLRGAYRQMLYIPSGSSYAKEATKLQADWLKTLKEQKVSLGPVTPPAHLSADQRSVWLRRQHGPEGFTTTQHTDGTRLTTWWYLDYSHYSFDERGRLVNQQVY
jgi:hypothetical protein